MLTYRSEIMANFQFLLILIVYVKTVQSIVPSAYYADNGVQTEKVHEMKSRDKRELRHEILTLLGLHKKPNPKDHSTKAYSAPKFMLSLYNSITTDDGAVNDDEKAFHTKHDVTIGDATIQPIEGTDVIVSYFNRARKIRHLRHEKDRTFFFDFSKESSNDTVVKGAELRLYKEKARRWKKHPFQIQIYMIKQGKDPEDKTLESLSNVTVAANHQGWITFNLTRAAVQWISSYKSNYGLFMKVLFIHKGREVDPGKFGIINNRGPKDKQPFMVGFYLSHTTLDMAKTRTAFRRKREAYRDEKEKYLDHSRQKRAAPGRWPCQRRSLYVKFRDLGWQLAVASFYENDESAEVMEDLPTDTPQPFPQQTTSGGPKSRFGTISNLQKSDSEDSEDDSQAFYAGGSEHSGQQILGPPSKKESGKKIVDNLFKSAREHGAEEVAEGSQPKSRGQHTNAFKGAGYKLGETEGDPVNIVHGGPLNVEVNQVDMVLKLWKNGFSIDDGPLRNFKDPANQEFLDSVSKGEVPRELTGGGKEVNLNMEDHRTEDYVQPKKTLKAFTGTGHMLGSPAPAIAKPSNTSSNQPNATATQQSIQVNQSEPVTTIQLRLADGSRMVLKLNHSHQISDIRNHITISHPEYASSNFILMTTFPNKELTNERQTLSDANLLNAVIVQKMK